MHRISSLFFFFNDTATTEIYTLSLHDALPISCASSYDKWVKQYIKHIRSEDELLQLVLDNALGNDDDSGKKKGTASRSEEHTSELQSRLHLVCRLLLEKKNKQST